MTHARHRLGGRGRIGVIQPAPGVVLEYEWARRLPTDVMAPVGRIPLTGGTAEAFDEAASVAPNAARDLATAGAGVIAYACSVGSLYAGAEAEAALSRRLAEAAKCPAASLSAASITALRTLDVRRICVITPYPPATNAWVCAYLQAAGLELASLAVFPVGIAQVGDLSPSEVADVCTDALEACPSADAMWIPCTAVQTLEALSAIEDRTGRPAVSGSQALLWASLRALGVSDKIADAGQLLARF